MQRKPRVCISQARGFGFTKKVKGLPLFTEVILPEMCGRKSFLLFFDADEDQYQKRHNIRRHLEQFLCLHRELRNGEEENLLAADVVVNDVHAAEDKGTDDGKARSPKGEDNEGNGKPSAVAETVARPYARSVVHDVIKSAESGDHAAETGGNIFVTVYVNAGCIRGGGIFADSTKRKAGTRLHQNMSGNKRDDDRQVSEETVGEYGLAQFRDDLRAFACLCGFIHAVNEAEMLRKATARLCKRYGRNVCVADLDEGAAEEVADAYAERGEREAGWLGAKRSGSSTEDPSDRKIRASTSMRSVPRTGGRTKVRNPLRSVHRRIRRLRRQWRPCT